MEVNVSKHVDAAPSAVAAVLFDPRRYAEWMGSVTGIDVPHYDWLAKGARVRHHGGLFGRKFDWTTEVADYVPERLLVLNYRDGPMNGDVRYAIEPAEDGGSEVHIHDRSGYDFSVLGWMVRQAVTENLDRLAKLVEDGARAAGAAADDEDEDADSDWRY